jgi:hypothetical protein
LPGSHASTSSSVWNIINTLSNARKTRVRHLSKEEVPACAIHWYVKNPKTASVEVHKNIRNTWGDIPQVVYDSFYKETSKLKHCKHCLWTGRIDKRNRVEQHVRAHLGFKPLICSVWYVNIVAYIYYNPEKLQVISLIIEGRTIEINITPSRLRLNLPKLSTSLFIARHTFYDFYLFRVSPYLLSIAAVRGQRSGRGDARFSLYSLVDRDNRGRNEHH